MPTLQADSAQLKYRPEIDGLRAVAVLAVIVFHAGVESLQGGFVGVDVFYVISGFLITRIVHDSLTEHRFSFAEFYARRIKRLFPAAGLLLIVTVAFGAVILTPYEYLQVARSAVASAVFLANAWFMMNSGYFDQSAEVSPLVHMWSLAVEEQFYLVFPVLLFAAYRWQGRRGFIGLLVVVTATSFALSVSLSAVYPNFAFYMLPTRAWELGVGGLLALAPRLAAERAALGNALSLLALVLLGYSMLAIGGDAVFPGYLAALPVVATALIIYSTSPPSSWLRRALATKPMVMIGRFSYSAYLWHWPVIVYYRIYVGERHFDASEVAILIGVSLLLGYLSWRFVEETFRHSKASTHRVYVGFAVGTAIVVAPALFVHLSRGFPQRIPEEMRSIASFDEMWDWECVESIRPFAAIDEEFCVVGQPWDEAETKGIVWGDSHSKHWAQILDLEAREHGASLVIAPTKCPPYLHADFVRSHYIKRPQFTEDCTARQNATVEWVNSNSELRVIIMAAAWSGHVRMLYDERHPENRVNRPIADRSSAVGASLSRSAMNRTIDRLDLEGRRLLLLGDMPRPNRELAVCALIERVDLIRSDCVPTHRSLSAPEVASWHADSDRVLADVAGGRDGVDLILPTKQLCEVEGCPTYVSGELIYFDSNHIRRNLETSTVQELARRLRLTQFFDSIDRG